MPAVYTSGPQKLPISGPYLDVNFILAEKEYDLVFAIPVYRRVEGAGASKTTLNIPGRRMEVKFKVDHSIPNAGGFIFQQQWLCKDVVFSGNNAFGIGKSETAPAVATYTFTDSNGITKTAVADVTYTVQAQSGPRFGMPDEKYTEGLTFGSLQKRWRWTYDMSVAGFKLNGEFVPLGVRASTGGPVVTQGQHYPPAFLTPWTILEVARGWTTPRRPGFFSSGPR